MVSSSYHYVVKSAPQKGLVKSLPKVFFGPFFCDYSGVKKLKKSKVKGTGLSCLGFLINTYPLITQESSKKSHQKILFNCAPPQMEVTVPSP
jgi:hypothetical protein